MKVKEIANLYKESFKTNYNLNQYGNSELHKNTSLHCLIFKWHNVRNLKYKKQ